MNFNFRLCFIRSMSTSLLIIFFCGFSWWSQAAESTLVSRPASREELARYQYYSMGVPAAVSVLYATAEMRAIEGAAANLIDGFMDGAVKQDDEMAEIFKKRKECKKKREYFARRDCAKSLIDDFERYGSRINRLARFSLNSRGVAGWDDYVKKFKIRNIGYIDVIDSCKIGPSICFEVGPYGHYGGEGPFGLAGDNLLCYRVDKELRRELMVDFSEDFARKLSRDVGDIRSVNGVVWLYQIVSPVRFIEKPVLCSGPGHSSDRIIGIGDARVSGFVLHDGEKFRFQDILPSGK